MEGWFCLGDSSFHPSPPLHTRICEMEGPGQGGPRRLKAGNEGFQTRTEMLAPVGVGLAPGNIFSAVGACNPL